MNADGRQPPRSYAPRHSLLPAVLLSLLAPASVRAAEPFATLAAGDARLAVQRDGTFSLTCGERVLIAGARLVVAGVEWKGSGQQDAGRLLDGFPKKEGEAVVLRGEILEPVARVTWRFEVRVEPAASGFRLAYAIEPLADTRSAEVSLFLDLPLETWRGRKVLLGRTESTTLPEQQPPQRHLLHATAREAVLGVGSERQVAFQFARPTLCSVQDAREFGAQVYHLYPRLFRGGAAQRGQVFRLEFTLLPDDKRPHAMMPQDHSSTAPLHLGPVALPAKSVPQCQRLEIKLDVRGTWRTPFDADEVRVDGHFRLASGREVVVPAFFTQDFELFRDGDEGWTEPQGEPHWALRFAGTEAGKHTLFATARDRSGEVRSDEAAFEVTPSAAPGYVRVSAKDPRYFAFDNGTPYFAVGENVCTWRRGVQDYDAWFPRLGAAGGNYARVWMWSHCFGVEWGKPGHYRLDHAWALDHALALAEQHGIYIKLCLEAWRGFRGPHSFVRPDVPHPYAKADGGPCEKEMDFFTDREARRMFRNRLRYVVARWGYSPHILAWEFWNEINCVVGYAERSQDMIAWAAEMGRALKQMDPWQHLVVNSLGSFEVDDRLWKLAEMDFAQVHGYWHPTHPAAKDAGKDMAEFVPHWIGKIRGYGKPALFAEFGLVNEHWGPSPRADEDAEGVHLHNGLWSSVMAGAAGTAMLWWWDSYVDPKNLYSQFTAVRRFTDGVPWTTAGFQPATLAASTPQLRALALVGRDRALLWLHNRQHTWWNVVEKRPIPEVREAAVTVAGLADGSYDVEWWDTWKGEVARRETRAAAGGALILPVDRLARDAAVKLVRQ